MIVEAEAVGQKESVVSIHIEVNGGNPYQPAPVGKDNDIEPAPKDNNIEPALGVNGTQCVGFFAPEKFPFSLVKEQQKRSSKLVRSPSPYLQVP